MSTDYLSQLYIKLWKKTGVTCPCLCLFGDAVYDSLHILLVSGTAGLIQNSAFLLFCHGGIGAQCIGVHSQRHAEAEGNFIIVHGFFLLYAVSACWIVHKGASYRPFTWLPGKIILHAILRLVFVRRIIIMNKIDSQMFVIRDNGFMWFSAG